MAQIRLAALKDIPAIADTYQALLTDEEAHGCHSNWKLKVYPTIRVPEAKVPAGEMYVLEEDGEICASMVLNQDQAEEYATVPWQYAADDRDVLVIHTLCIPPQKAGRGYGSRMVAFAKALCREKGYRVIRLDTYVHNEPAKALYQKNGFRIAGYGDIVLQGLIPEKQVYLECSIEVDKHTMMISSILEKMICYSDGNIHDIDHLIRVWTYAKTIGELERLDKPTQLILEVAAITHDIACPLCREKYGNTNGKHQEREGAIMVRDFLVNTGLTAEQVDRVSFLVGHHHTMTGIEGADWQILIEADYIANASENGYSEGNIQSFLQKIAKTTSGKKLIHEVFCI